MSNIVFTKNRDGVTAYVVSPAKFTFYATGCQSQKEARRKLIEKLSAMVDTGKEAAACLEGMKVEVKS